MYKRQVLVVSASEDVDEKSLKKMVEDINRNYLLPDEYLSDNVYKYNLIYNSLEMIEMCIRDRYHNIKRRNYVGKYKE